MLRAVISYTRDLCVSRAEHENEPHLTKNDAPFLDLVTPPLSSSSSGNNDSSGIVDRGPPHQVFYEDARNALAAFQQAGDDDVGGEFD